MARILVTERSRSRARSEWPRQGTSDVQFGANSRQLIGRGARCGRSGHPFSDPRHSRSARCGRDLVAVGRRGVGSTTVDIPRGHA